MTTSSHVQKEAGQEGGGFPIPALTKTKVSAASFLSCYPEMKMLHLGSVVGFEVLFLLSPPRLSSYKSINHHRYWEAASKGGACQGHYQQGLGMRHLGGTEIVMEASLQTSSVIGGCLNSFK